MKEEKTKMTEIGEIPESWEVESFSNLCSFSAGRTPARNIKKYWDDGNFPWLTIADMKQGQIILKTKEKVSQRAMTECFRKNYVKKGTLLMSFKLTIGRTCFAGCDLVHNEAIISIHPQKELNKMFISYYLPNIDYKEYQDRQIKGNTLNREKISRIKIPLPPLPEQEKIATVLNKIQRSIEMKDKLIKATQELKKSTMKHLFTYGTKKEKTKMTEIGEIPESWEISNIDNQFDLKQGKSLSSKNQIGNYLKPFLRTSNVFWGYLNLLKVDEMDIPLKDRGVLVLRYGDLLVCEGGDIGRTAIWSEELRECYFQNHIHRLRVKNKKETFSLFYMYWLDVGIRLLKVYGTFGNRTTIPNLSGKRLLEFLIPLPPLPEQKKIASILSKIDERIKNYEEQKTSLKALFKSMLNKLMTGQIRVHNLNIDTSEVEK